MRSTGDHAACAIAILAPILLASCGTAGPSGLRAPTGFIRSFASENGRYVIEAARTDRRGRSLPKDFKYRLIDMDRKATLWERSRDERDSSYKDCFVNNRGRAVLILGSWCLDVIDPQGQTVRRIDVIEEALTATERSRYVRHGLHNAIDWAEYSLWYFTTFEDLDLLVIRPWWGRRILVNLVRAEIVKETKEIRQRLEEHESAWVLRKLDDGIRQKDFDAGIGRAFRSITAVTLAAYLAGELSLREGIPRLRALEKVPLILIPVLELDNDLTDMCEAIHLALRRLGEEPGSPPCSMLKPSEDSLKLAKAAGDVLQNESGAGELEAGQSREEVLRLIGPPDCADSTSRGGAIVGKPLTWHSEWVYEMDGARPYTMTLYFEEKLVRIERDAPPLWQSRWWDKRLLLWASAIGPGDNVIGLPDTDSHEGE